MPVEVIADVTLASHWRSQWHPSGASGTRSFSFDSPLGTNHTSRGGASKGLLAVILQIAPHASKLFVLLGSGVAKTGEVVHPSKLDVAGRAITLLAN